VNSTPTNLEREGGFGLVQVDYKNQKRTLKEESAKVRKEERGRVGGREGGREGGTCHTPHRSICNHTKRHDLLSSRPPSLPPSVSNKRCTKT